MFIIVAVSILVIDETAAAQRSLFRIHHARRFIPIKVRSRLHMVIYD